MGDGPGRVASGSRNRGDSDEYYRLSITTAEGERRDLRRRPKERGTVTRSETTVWSRWSMGEGPVVSGFRYAGHHTLDAWSEDRL